MRQVRRISDDLFDQLEAEVIEDFLLDRDWRRIEELSSLSATTLEAPDASHTQIVVPRWRRLADYHVHMARTVREVAIVEERPIETILNVFRDPIRIFSSYRRCQNILFNDMDLVDEALDRHKVLVYRLAELEKYMIWRLRNSTLVSNEQFVKLVSATMIKYAQRLSDLHLTHTAQRTLDLSREITGWLQRAA
ncbi:MAG: hypothetical protein ACYTGL_07770 [Planctomycetota bacterium]|jgi:hypothetical protein